MKFENLVQSILNESPQFVGDKNLKLIYMVLVKTVSQGIPKQFHGL